MIGNIFNLRVIEDVINKIINFEKEIKDDVFFDLRDIRFYKKILNMNIKRKFEEFFEELFLFNVF